MEIKRLKKELKGKLKKFDSDISDSLVSGFRKDSYVTYTD